jgi:hypothetical protein
MSAIIQPNYVIIQSLILLQVSVLFPLAANAPLLSGGRLFRTSQVYGFTNIDFLEHRYSYFFGQPQTVLAHHHFHTLRGVLQSIAFFDLFICGSFGVEGACIRLTFGERLAN